MELGDMQAQPASEVQTISETSSTPPSGNTESSHSKQTAPERIKFTYVAGGILVLLVILGAGYFAFGTRHSVNIVNTSSNNTKHHTTSISQHITTSISSTNASQNTSESAPAYIVSKNEATSLLGPGGKYTYFSNSNRGSSSGNVTSSWTMTYSISTNSTISSSTSTTSTIPSGPMINSTTSSGTSTNSTNSSGTSTNSTTPTGPTTNLLTSTCPLTNPSNTSTSINQLNTCPFDGQSILEVAYQNSSAESFYDGGVLTLSDYPGAILNETIGAFTYSYVQSQKYNESILIGYEGNEIIYVISPYGLNQTELAKVIASGLP